ncbi:unnamed protein product [Ectocarpus sp. 12 AP-2014]
MLSVDTDEPYLTYRPWFFVSLSLFEHVAHKYLLHRTQTHAKQGSSTCIFDHRSSLCAFVCHAPPRRRRWLSTRYTTAGTMCSVQQLQPLDEHVVALKAY